MSNTYSLVCFQCCEGLPLGKSFCTDEEGHLVAWTFSGFLSETDGSRINGDALLKLVTHFLLVHRTHELRLLLDSAFENVPFEQVTFIESPEQLLERHVDPAVDEAGERAIAATLASRLSKQPGEPTDRASGD